MTSLIYPCPKRALIPLKFEVIFNYDTFFKVAQSYPHGPKLAQLTVSQLSEQDGNCETCRLVYHPRNEQGRSMHGVGDALFSQPRTVCIITTDSCCNGQ